MNIVPYSAFPNGSTERIQRRLPLREQILFERLDAADGGNFTIVPAGYYTPLPATNLLGAPTLHERDDICIAMLRYLATKPSQPPGDIKYRFMAFTRDGGGEHDPSRELLQRVKDLKLAIEPVSKRKESRREDGMRVDSDESEHGVLYDIFSIRVIDGDNAEVEVNECPRFAAGGQRFTYSLTRKNGQWVITEERPGFIFGQLQRQAEFAGNSHTVPMRASEACRPEL